MCQPPPWAVYVLCVRHVNTLRVVTYKWAPGYCLVFCLSWAMFLAASVQIVSREPTLGIPLRTLSSVSGAAYGE